MSINSSIRRKICNDLFDSPSQRSTHIDRCHKVFISVKFKDNKIKSMTRNNNVLFECMCDDTYTRGQTHIRYIKTRNDLSLCISCDFVLNSVSGINKYLVSKHLWPRTKAKVMDQQFLDQSIRSPSNINESSIILKPQRITLILLLEQKWCKLYNNYEMNTRMTNETN